MYIHHTIAEYLSLIDRAAHLAHVAAVAAAIIAGHAPPAAIPFSEALDDAHDELQSAFDVHVALLLWNVVHAGAGAAALNAAQALKIANSAALNAAQALKIANSLATLMKDCNANLATAL
jgi:hypothetical protein